jgi:uncharacterized protein
MGPSFTSCPLPRLRPRPLPQRERLRRRDNPALCIRPPADTMTRQFCLEVSKTAPHGAFVQVDLGDDDGAPLFGQRDGPADVVPHGGQHPVAGDVLVRTTDHVHVVLDRAGLGQFRVAAPDRPHDDLGPAVSQLARDFGEEPVVADHHRHLAEPRGEHRILVTRSDSVGDFIPWQRHLAVLARQLAVGRQERGGVVDEMSRAFVEPNHDVQVVLLGQLSEVRGRRAGDCLGCLLHCHAVADDRHALAQHDQVRLLLRGLGDQRRELPAVIGGRLAAAGTVVHGRQPHLAARRSRDFCQADIAPLDSAPGSPQQTQFEHRLRRLGWGPVRVGDLRPAAGVGGLVGRVFSFCRRFEAAQISRHDRLIVRDALAGGVQPSQLHHRAPPRQVHVLDLAHGVEVVVSAAGHPLRLDPPSVQTFAAVGANDKCAGALGSAARIVGEFRPNLVARRRDLPPFRCAGHGPLPARSGGGCS